MPKVIAWRSKVTGFEGQGTYEFKTVEDINLEISRLNTKFPEIEHYVKVL